MRRAVAAEAGKHKSGLFEREQMSVNALGNDAGYQAIIGKYPADLEPGRSKFGDSA
jgi:hypothetical protein